MTFSRRQFMSRTALVSASLTTAGLFAKSGVAGAFPPEGYGPLIADPDGICDLPAGFTYKVLASTEAAGPAAATQLGTRSPAENLGPVPGAPDALGSFYDASTKRTYLVCNHELSSGSGVPKSFRGAPVPTYDVGAGAAGGCTVLVLDESMEVIEHVPLLAGTIRNCAGGMTPWGTWLTCEETTTSAGATTSKNHGYLFEVDPKGGLTNAVPYSAMGRAAHEAVAINPANGFAYITEDSSGGLVYKFSPTNTSPAYGALGDGGALYAMKVPNYADFALLAAVGAGTKIADVSWTVTTTPDVASLKTSFDSATVTRGNKLEGCWWVDDSLWFVSSYSGTAHSGAVFKYTPSTATIEVVYVMPAGGMTVELTDGVTVQSHLLRDPDNIAATPYGGIIWSQDGGDSQYLVLLAPDGDDDFRPVPFAKNPSSGEWAGAHFSPDGKWLFANQQSQNRTLAITGPWSSTPPPVIPEVPFSLLLPLSGAALGAGLLAVRNRRVAEAKS
jgi:uncharacterized protein